MNSVDANVTFQLVKRAQSGDRTALDGLFRRYYGRVLQVVRRRLGRRLREELESGDILQESFAVALRKLDTFEMRHEASLIAWMKTIVERKILDEVDRRAARKRDGGRVVSIDAADRDSSRTFDVTDSNGPAGGSPLQCALRREQITLIDAYVMELPEHYRDLILLRNYEGYDWERIARITDRPSADAARMMYVKALLELGRLIRSHRRESASGSNPAT